MRIGVDATSWANGRGYGRFTRELISHMAGRAPADELLLLIESQNAELLRRLPANVAVLPVDLRAAPSDAAKADGRRSLGDMLKLTRAAARARFDVLFYPTVYTYFPAPLGRRVVVTIHDAIAERFPELTLPSRRARFFWNAKVALAKRQANLVLTVSDFAAGELASVLGIPRARLRVCGEAPAPAFTPSASRSDVDAAARRVGLPPGARWIVYVGGFSPHKHVDSVVRAHAAVARSRAERLFLLLVGKTSGDAFLSERPAIQRAIDAGHCAESVIWTGFVADGELRHLLSGAVACLLPSANEGYGLPAVEAAACGWPVSATRASPLPEILADGGVFVAPADDAAMAATLARWLDDEPERARRGALARARAAALDWNGAADKALACLREAAI
jgi:glycosyltransferase involved in cell wall biosynthesis